VAALSYFEAHAEEIDLVLLDVLMPVLDGKATLTAMRKIKPTLPVVFMSGFDRAKLVDLEDGSIEFVQKPFGWDSLTSAVAKGVRASGQENAG
jgi:two-component system cell cycle sensor histidine kinase/response regulator CckA